MGRFSLNSGRLPRAAASMRLWRSPGLPRNRSGDIWMRFPKNRHRHRSVCPTLMLRMGPCSTHWLFQSHYRKGFLWQNPAEIQTNITFQHEDPPEPPASYGCLSDKERHLCVLFNVFPTNPGKVGFLRFYNSGWTGYFCGAGASILYNATWQQWKLQITAMCLCHKRKGKV